jgi:branched-chain amino acid transport system ATP-binding protein
VSPCNVVLHVADVKKSFGGLHALSDIDHQIEEGKPAPSSVRNGAGKSTLLNICVGRLGPIQALSSSMARS